MKYHINIEALKGGYIVELLTNKAVGIAKQKGADLVGICRVDPFSDYINTRYDLSKSRINSPEQYLPGAQSIIVIGLRMLDSICNSIKGKSDANSSNLFNYLMNYFYNQLDYVAIQLSLELEKMGYAGYPIQARREGYFRDRDSIGIFPYKEAAVVAGLGNYGKNSLLITPEFGPRVRFAVVLTDAILCPTNKNNNILDIEAICGSCTLCIDKCPVEAIKYDDNMTITIDSDKCRAYMDWCQCALCLGICPKGLLNRNKIK